MSELRHRGEPVDKEPVDKKPADKKPADKRSGLPDEKVRSGRKPHFRKTAKFYPYTILDSPEWQDSLFYGFYVLFWIITTVLCSRILVMNYLTTGRLLETNVIGILRRDLLHVAAIDLLMYVLMYVTFGMQVLVKRGYVDWGSWGWIWQHAYQAIFLGFFVLYARVHDFPWIAQIFLTLHALVQMMKMHSYAVFNGYMNHLERVVRHEEAASRVDKTTLDDARKELSVYPHNVTLGNFFWYTMFPTVVYEIEYPRTERIRWRYALRKIAATLGIFMCMIVISEQLLHPITVHANDLRQSTSLAFRFKRWPVIFLELFPPFMFVYILTFYIIWDAICNSIAELTRFGDREFYRDWWNSTEWAKFARDWNVPVHNFLQRHVYTSSILFLKLSKTQAMFFTFFFSACVHELAMWVIFGRLRGYLFLMQLTQLPMQLLSQLKYLKDRPTIGITLFWFGIALGPSILCATYLTF